ncbi:MAG: glycosyl hydrolase, partial [Bacteroidota bacterium]|nr:glycosyl hydrolase [Bacteroidota bacterium]
MKKLILIIAAFTIVSTSFSQKKKNEDKNPLDKLSISALKWRSIGPALTSGRISDLAINPNKPFEYYVAVASGGVWKTTNWGVDYKPIFDRQGSYSIGCVSIDPKNPNVVWVGTGENNNQRSVAYGDGVYKSVDGGASWKNMGLKSSEHIGNILIHPENSDIVYVSAYGPLWNKGGDRGIYKTIDGGKSWNKILFIDEHTGFNEIHMDPRNPDVLYATSHQRRRHVYTYVGGGPGSGIHKSVDGGNTWRKINKGLPGVEIGRIGMDISDANPEVIYAIVEASERKGGFYKSTNRGESWQKQSSKVTSGNYYQEIFADPVDVDVVYVMDTYMGVTKDGGKTFKYVEEKYKHVDNHAMWINPKNNSHWLVGCDGGIYETFDKGAKWDYKKNLPVTQFYKVSVDNSSPFYNVYGGTQDNYTLGGPSRVNNSHGISNQDWFVTHGGDGFETQVDPINPNIVYSQSQYGFLVRYDKLSGEEVGIKPIARKGELSYKWNWDAPLSVSNHVPGRLYFAANKVFKSDDYGNSWEVISEDLTRQLNRNELKVYDRVLSIDAVEKNGSTSPYGTIVALSESPLDANLIAIGTDDGLIQITDDGGDNWKKIDNISGAPKRSYVNSVYLSKHDVNVIYVAFNHHKYGDFKPYIFMSKDKGKSWESISNNLPERGSVYSLEEDHEKEGLIFCGTEFGAFFSPDFGKRWKKL